MGIKAHRAWHRHFLDCGKTGDLARSLYFATRMMGTESDRDTSEAAAAAAATSSLARRALEKSSPGLVFSRLANFNNSMFGKSFHQVPYPMLCLPRCSSSLYHRAPFGLASVASKVTLVVRRSTKHNDLFKPLPCHFTSSHFIAVISSMCPIISFPSPPFNHHPPSNDGTTAQPAPRTSPPPPPPP